MKKILKTSCRVLCTVFLLALFSLLPGCGESSGEGARPDSSSAFSVCFRTPEGERVLSAAEGSVVKLEAPADREGCTFIGWMDEQGRIEQRDDVAVYQDLVFSAVYVPVLGKDEHAAYLFPDQYGLFRPNDDMTRSDAAIMLHALLRDPPKGSGSFIDVPADADCYEAVSSLKALGVVTGSRFHPEEGITRAELLEMLCFFAPRARSSFDFKDLSRDDGRYPLFCTAAEQNWIESGADVKAMPDQILSRLDTARLMNRVLGRAADRSFSAGQVGVMADVLPTDPAYADMAEACVCHSGSLKGETEEWTDSTPIQALEEGLHLFGLRLCAVDAGGSLVHGEEYRGFRFDENGRYTSGNPELDALIGDLFTEILDPASDREEMLHACYRYEVENFRYLGKNHYPYKDLSWVMDEAVSILSTKKGNCYGFAGAFCMMARALGYDANCVNGFVSLDFTQHAWVEIEIDGVLYIFDPEIEYAQKQDGKISNMYKMDPDMAAQWYYVY